MTSTKSTLRQPWRNWAGTATAHPVHWCRPADRSEIATAITDAARAGRTVRALGTGHSFTPIAATSGVAVDLSGWHGIESADIGTGLVTVRSGTTLRALNRALDQHGLAMTNLGDIDAQTIAGAISTGTHGTGARFGGIATQVEALELVLADGSIVSCSREHDPELFAAAGVSLGALGVLSTVTLRCEPAFLLSALERSEPVDEVLDRFDELADGNDHFEFYWFPYGRNALVKRNNRLPAGSAPAPLTPARRYFEYQIMENTALGTLCRIGRAVPALVKPFNRFSSAATSTREYRDVSHRVFVTTRRVRFVESEYAIPRESVVDVLTELRRQVPKLADPVMLPVEVRVMAGDDIWLSCAYGRDTACVAIHQYVGMPYRAYFDLFESVVATVGGRPHWGKIHSLDAERLSQRYPRFEDFRRTQAQLDPDGRFTNAYLNRVLGPVG